MFRIYLFFVVLLIAGVSAQAQHFDELYQQDIKLLGPEKTWRDSGYYFVPALVRFDVNDIFSAGSGEGRLASVVFQSTDNSGLTFSGQASFFFRPNNFPNGVELLEGSRGLATVLLPQDLLFCPDEETEQGMGQDDPYFPLSLVGRFERIGEEWITPPILTIIQLNDFVVN